MNTLANPDDKKLLLERVAKLRTDSPRAWGKMSPHQMVCHLCDSSRLALGEKQAHSVSNLFKRTVMKWVALALPAPWPRGIKTMPEFDQNIGGTPPAEFEKDRSILISLTERLAKQPASVAAAVHPFFAKMAVEEWMRWAWLHMDHHLRQFGC